MVQQWRSDNEFGQAKDWDDLHPKVIQGIKWVTGEENRLREQRRAWLANDIDE